MTMITRSPSFEDLEWAENDYSHPTDRIHSPIARRTQAWHDWIFSDQDISLLNEDSFKLSPRKCHRCNKILQKDAPFTVNFCSVACRQVNKS